MPSPTYPIVRNGKLAANFDATDEDQFQQPDFPSYSSFIADKIKDGDDYKVKFTRVNRRWFDKTLAKSHKFRIFRIGGQPKIPNGYRYVADINIPTVLGPQAVPALDMTTMKRYLSRSLFHHPEFIPPLFHNAHSDCVAFDTASNSNSTSRSLSAFPKGSR